MNNSIVMKIKSLIRTLFGIRPEERWLAAIATVVFSLLNALTIHKYFNAFTQLSDNYRKLFVSTFHISGFDPLTYQTISDWDTAYNVYRHPLLAFFMYPPYLVNQLLVKLTGVNCVQFVVAALLVISSVYAVLFLYRILHELIGTTRTEAVGLVVLFFGFAYIMLSTMVPDHFGLSMSVLLMTIYLCGLRQKSQQPFTIPQTILLFILTAGISLNNGIKTFLGGWMTNGRRFFHWRYLLLAVILPSALLWGFARWEYRHYVWPKEMARKEAKNKAKTKRQEAAKTATLNPSTEKQGKDKEPEKKGKSAAERRKEAMKKKMGTPIMEGEFMRWTDISTSRSQSVVENLFGESIQFHRDHLLGDVLRSRPVIVTYRSVMNYLVEFLLVGMFLIGIILGRRSRLLWTTLSFFAADMILHVGLGFGINEIYIMSPHYLYAMPVAMGFLLVKTKGTKRMIVQTAIASLASFLWVYNGRLLVLGILGV